jgi:hypothetical protein
VITIMNTATLHHPVLRRFAWKEYRMVRGFWLAVLVLGVLEQWVSTLLVDDLKILPGWLLASAWGAAALYAVGAAVTLFGAENEERTRSFLQVLPRHTGPLVAGKFAVALASSLLLALVLSLTGWLLSRGSTTNIDVRFAVAIGGVAILETTAWGMLFSILWQQPLLAAVVALGAASFGAQLAIAATPGQRVLYAVSSYYDAIPARLAICLAVFAVDLLLARRWLDAGRSRKSRTTANTPAAEPAAGAIAQPVAVSAVRGFRGRMLWRLVWQTWREAWRPLLLAIPVALFLMFALTLPLAFEIDNDGGYEPLLGLLALLTGLFLPALWGALVFRADQKGQHRLFLTTHAARPRMVWLSRQLVWLGSALLPMSAILIAGGVWLYSFFQRMDPHPEFNALSFFALSWCAFMTAYCIGQLCSMLLKQEVLAGFLALLLSVVLVVWSGVVFYWGLPVWWFVLLLGAAAMAATWWWTPDWLVGRQGWRGWLQPAVPVAVALGLIALSLPAVRIAQVNLPRPQYPFLATPLAASLAELEAHRAEGQETALEYERLWGQLRQLPEFEELRVDGKTWKEWGGDEISDSPESGDPWGAYGDPNYVMSPEEEAHQKTQMVLEWRFQREAYRIYAERNQAVVERLLELCKRENCQFSSQALSTGQLYNYLEPLRSLLEGDGERLTAVGELDAALDRYCACYRIQAHVLDGQPTQIVTYRRSFSNFGNVAYNGILAWAQYPDQTSERLRKAIDELSEAFTHIPGPREAILADYLRIRDVINEKELPSTWGGEKKNRTTAQVLAYLANKLPWERRRALVALDCLTINNLNYADAVVLLTLQGPYSGYLLLNEEMNPRRLLQAIPWRCSVAEHTTAFSNDTYRSSFLLAHLLNAQCRTSALMAQELDASTNLYDLLHSWLTEETRRRALLVQLALLAYRLDHGEYPETLAELNDGYLPHSTEDDPGPEFLPYPLARGKHYYYPYTDPFAGAEFQYHPQGLAHPLEPYQDSRVARIPAGMPFLRSVEAGNRQLEEVRNNSNETVIRLRLTEFTGRPEASWESENLVFPLPK